MAAAGAAVTAVTAAAVEAVPTGTRAARTCRTRHIARNASGGKWGWRDGHLCSAHVGKRNKAHEPLKNKCN